MAKRKLPPNLADWVSARGRYRLTHAQVQMARELGMNPKKLGGLANHEQERWKAPLPQFIEERYEKRFGRPAPENVRSIEELARAKEEKRAARKAAKRRARDREAEVRADADFAKPPREIGRVSASALPSFPADLPAMAPPSSRLSDALFVLVSPHLPWPLGPNDLGGVRRMVQLTATVWNTSLVQDPETRDQALRQLAEGAANRNLPARVILGVVRGMLARKLELYPHDFRCVIDVTVELDGDRFAIHASSAHRP